MRQHDNKAMADTQKVLVPPLKLHTLGSLTAASAASPSKVHGLISDTYGVDKCEAHQSFGE